MKRIIIEIPEPGDERRSFDVVTEDGLRCDGLCYGEMLEQVVALTWPDAPRKTGYEMKTPQGWQEWQEAITGRAGAK